MDADGYLSADDGPETELKVRGSRFLGRVFAVADDAAAATRVADVRRRHHAASHHATAWRCGAPDEPVERCDDDGEPSGTAGRPMLEQLRGRRLHDVLVVVTRYFGGTRLGTGGLVRAYAEAAALALDAAPRVEVVREATLTVDCGFDDLGAVEGALARRGEDVRRVERDWSAGPRLTVVVRRSRARDVGAAIVEATAGRAKVLAS